GGFEGRLSVREGPPAHDLVGPNGEHKPIPRHLGRDAAMPTPLALVADQRDDLSSLSLAHVLNLELEVFPRGQPPSPIDPYAVMASVYPCQVKGDATGPRSVPFDVGVVEVECPLVISASKRLQQVAYNLHVLVRHRPPQYRGATYFAISDACRYCFGDVAGECRLDSPHLRRMGPGGVGSGFHCRRP